MIALGGGGGAAFGDLRPRRRDRRRRHDYREIIYLSVPDTVTERLLPADSTTPIPVARTTCATGPGWNTRSATSCMAAPVLRRRRLRRRPEGEPAAATAGRAGGHRRDRAGRHQARRERRRGRRLADGRGASCRRPATMSAGTTCSGSRPPGSPGTTATPSPRASACATDATRRRLGLEVLDYVPTVRIPDQKRTTEVAFDIPADADRLVVRNFDAAAGRVAFAST